MKTAIIERIENYEEDKPFNKRYYLDNSFDLAPNFKVTAISEDGIIEGIEKNNIVAV